MLKSSIARLVQGYGAIELARKGTGVIALVTALLCSKAVNAEPIRILALGDSLVQGYGLAPDDGFVPQLEDWLERHGITAAIINAGVSGDTSVSALERIDWVMVPKPQFAIVALGGNDVLRGFDPELTRKTLGEILRKFSENEIPVLLVGIAAPGNYGPDYQEAFRSLYRDLSETHDTLLYPNFLRVLLGMEDRDMVLSTYYQADKLHPNKEGIAMVVDDIGPFVAELVSSSPQ